MLADTEKSGVETYIVLNDHINLVSVLVPCNKGKASVYGTIQFKNGKTFSFSSDQDDHEILYERLTFVCQQIANYYGAKVIRGKEQTVGSENQTQVPFKEIFHSLN